MVPHEEYGTPRFNFYEDMVGAHYYSHLQQHPLLLYDDAHLHGCTYGIHLSHLETHAFPFSLSSPLDVGGNSSHTWVKRYMMKENYYWKKNHWLFHDDIHIHGCIDETSLSHLNSSCFLCFIWFRFECIFFIHILDERING